MSTKNKSQGFALLEILLLVVTLSFVIAIAWVVIHHSKDSTNKKSVSSAQNNFIEIAEWRVKLTLPDKSQKISYKVAGANPKEIVLSSEALDKFAADHKECSGANQYITIARTKVGEPLNGTPWEQAKPLLEKNGSKNLGLFYYFNGARPSVSPCIGTNIAQIQALNNQAFDLYDQLPSYNNIVINP
jgi:type II secretory pathway pseudopilin PulG